MGKWINLKIRLVIVTFLLVTLGLFAQPAGASTPFSSAIYIDDGSFNEAFGVYAADIDGDGDMDVLGASVIGDDITWWENDGTPSGGNWTEHIIDGSFDSAYSVHAADVDGDGDMDVLGAAPGASEIAWWENTSGNGSTWDKTVLDDAAYSGAWYVHAADIDGDGDMDIVGTGNSDDYIRWWENTDGNGNFSSGTFVSNTSSHSNGPYCAYPVDIDDDNDLDLVAACYHGNMVRWFENDGTPTGGGWAYHDVDGDKSTACSAHSADIDGDGDMDVVGSSWDHDDVLWWENDGTPASGTWPEHQVDGFFDGPHWVYAADINDDGDIDILGAGSEAKEIALWENNGSGGFSSKRILGSNLKGRCVYATDVDGDYDIDVVAACNDEGIVWFRNDSPAKYAGGYGTADDPFLISEPNHMQNIGANPHHWDKHFLVIADINMAQFTGTQYNIIGNGAASFTGIFNGNRHTISNFTYTSAGTSQIGLFGQVGSSSEIKNLGLVDPNVNADPNSIDVGGLVGFNNDGTVQNCYSIGGYITGGSYVGGLVGRNNGLLSFSYETSTVTGDSIIVGGLVGYNDYGTVSNCYAWGSISGTDRVGGLVGNNNYGTIFRCYAAGPVDGNDNTGGFVGYDYSGGYTDSFWDNEINPDSNGIGNESSPDPNVTSKTTAEMKTVSTFFNAGWDLVGTWNIEELQTYPLVRKYLAVDLNYDYQVDFVDFAYFAEHWLEGI